MTDSTKKHQIQIESQRNQPTHGVLAEEELSLLANLLNNNVEIDHSCGGFGTCGTCCIQVLEGSHHISEVTEIEAEMKSDRGMRDNERLSCQAFISGKIKIKVP